MARARETVAGKVVAVTGGGRGIGFAIARAVRDAGGTVVIGDIDAGAVEKAGAELGVTALALDVTERKSFEDFVDGAEAAAGPLDVLVNNAGLMPIGPVIAVTDAEAARCIDVNLHGVMLGTQLALRRMLPRGRGQIVNIASVAGVTPAPGIALYNASKAGVVAFTEATRIEVLRSGVRVGAVLPSFTNTELISGTGHPKGQRPLEPADVAAGVLDMIARPRPRLTVPRGLGVMLRLGALYPERLTRALYRWMDVDTMFVDIDQAARAGYDARIHAAPGDSAG
ncbi:SDR family oxidoreductase [Nocardia sp. NPDC059240]|uniref:SDR family oxidoreductase n=1 Tax=Nocardia sp. NPDC059240 TaxID=3346786 RepID=UPI0036821EE8